jgi:hypothetical protein
MEKDNLKEFKDKISDWSDKKIGNQYFDEIFQIDGTPLSWFYRPIIYSSLLPKPFVTIDYLVKKKKIKTTKLKSFSYLLQKYLSYNDKIKRLLSLLKKENIKSEKEKILFLTFTNHIANDGKSIFRINSIINKIKEDGLYEPLLLVIDPISRLSIQKIFKCENSLYHYYNERINKKLRAFAGSLANKWKEIDEEDKAKMLMYKNVNVFNSLKHNLNFIYSKEFLYLVIKYYLTFRGIIKNERIKAVLLTSQNNIFEKSLIAATKKENLPVYIIQHGIGLGTLSTIDTPENVRFAVFSEKYKKELEKLRVSPENIKIVGPIIFDGIEKFVGEKREEKGRKEESKNEEGRESKVLLATSPFIEDRFVEKEDYFCKIKKILTELKKSNLSVTIKLHPRERTANHYQEIGKELGLKIKISTEVGRENHYRLINESDLIISFGSTVALEAMIIGRPTLTINLFDGPNPTNPTVFESGASTIVNYQQDISGLALELLSENKFKIKADTFIKNLCYKIDGKASERIVEEMYKAIDK